MCTDLRRECRLERTSEAGAGQDRCKKISFSARRVVVSMGSEDPWQALFGQAWAALRY